MFESTSFPDPTILKAKVSTGFVSLLDELTGSRSEQQVSVLYSSSGARYELGEVLKEAIYGAVIRARLLKPVPSSSPTFIRTSISYAVKVYSKELLFAAGDYSNKENPIMELGALQYISGKHSNLIEQIECCADEEFIYSILRYYPGGELFDHIANHGPMGELEAKIAFYNLLRALLKLRDLGIVHRDISLENILYQPSSSTNLLPQMVLIDFGLCTRMTKDHHHPHTLYSSQGSASASAAADSSPICGKRNYIPPEILAENNNNSQRGQYGHASDLWSAGVCLLYMLLGFPAFEYAKEDDVRFAFFLQGKLRELLQHWQISLSEIAVDFIYFVLQPNPLHRPSLEDILLHPWMAEVHDLLGKFPLELSSSSPTLSSAFSTAACTYMNTNTAVASLMTKASHTQTLVAA